MMSKVLLAAFAALLLIESSLAYRSNLTITPIAERNLEQEAKNKQIVLDFYQELVGDHDLSAIDRYIDENQYIQHNPKVPNGREGLRALATKWWKDKPGYQIDYRRAVAEDDLVWIHLKDKWFGETSAFVDIFRLRNNKIVEHWDIIQRIPEVSANPTPMFNSEYNDYKEQTCEYRKQQVN